MGSIQQIQFELPVPFVEALMCGPVNTNTMLVDAIFDDNRRCLLNGLRTSKSVTFLIEGKDGGMHVDDQRLFICVKSGEEEKEAEEEDVLTLTDDDCQVLPDAVESIQIDLKNSTELEEYASEVFTQHAGANGSAEHNGCITVIEQKLFPCPDPNCPRLFQGWNKLKRHILNQKLHKKQSNYNEIVEQMLQMSTYKPRSTVQVLCPVCGVKRSITSILKHLKSMHASDPHYENFCAQCNELMKEYSPDEAAPCPHCLKPFKSLHLKRRHIKYHCVQNPLRSQIFSCRLCCFQSVSKDKLAAHTDTHLLACDVCSEKYESEELLSQHKDSQHSQDSQGSVLPIPLAVVSAIDGLYAQDFEGEKVAEVVMISSDEEQLEDNGDITYVMMDDCSQRGAPQLVDSLGYRYNKRPGRIGSWRCCVRNNKNCCGGSVLERNGVFKRGKMKHLCLPNPARAQLALIRKITKDKAKNNPSKSAAAIVNEVLASNPGILECGDVPKPYSLARQVTRARQKSKATQPNELLFELLNTRIPSNFLRADVSKNGRRHIMFASDVQLKALAKAKKWFIDSTARFVHKPFTQLFTVHGYIGKAKRLIPLLFVFMSGSSLIDYTLVLEQVKLLLPQSVLTQVSADFEVEMWESVSEVLKVAVKGCFFHFNQAFWRKVGALGLQELYREDAVFQNLCRLLMSLPLLPYQHIPAVFHSLRQLSESVEAETLFSYFEDTWLSDTWSVESWSVYGERVRAIDDVEGWMAHLQDSTESQDFYHLVENLHKEAEQIPIIQAEMLTSKTSESDETNLRLVKLWGEYSKNTRTARLLLEAGSCLVCPKITQ